MGSSNDYEVKIAYILILAEDECKSIFIGYCTLATNANVCCKGFFFFSQQINFYGLDPLFILQYN